MRNRLSVLVAIVTTLAMLRPISLFGQQITCLEPDSCEKAGRKDHELIMLRLTNANGQPAARTIVSLNTSAGTIVDAVRSDAAGIVRAKWTGDAGGKDVDIQVTAWLGDALVRKQIKLKPEPATDKPRLVQPGQRAFRPADLLWSTQPQWYQARQLKETFEVGIDGVSDAACQKTGVLLHAYGDKGQAVPDTAYAKVYTYTSVDGSALTRCEARFRWTLGAGVGRQSLRATLVGDPQQRRDFTAASRALPWFGLGIVQARDQGFVTGASGKLLLKATRKTVNAAGDTITLAYDSTVTTKVRPDTVARGDNLIPVAAVNFPVVLRLQWLRMSVAADLVHPDRNWFVGFSLNQLLAGFQHEDIGFDLQGVVHIARRDEIRGSNLSDCTAPASTVACKAQPHSGIVGGGLMVMVNTSSVLEKLITSLTPK